MLKNFGVEGITYDMVGGKPVYTDLITKNPDGLNLAQSLRKYTQASYPVAGMDDPDYLMQYYKYPQQEEAAKIYSQYADNANLVNLPPISATEEETQELATLNTEIQTYVDEMFLKFIMGVESIENFDKFVEQLKKMKIERVIELRQTAVNRYNNR